MPSVKEVVCQKERICSTCKEVMHVGYAAIKDKRNKDRRTKYYCSDNCYRSRQR